MFTATKKNVKVIEPRIVNAVKLIENVEKLATPKSTKNQTCFPLISHDFHDSFLLDQIFEEAINKHNPESEKLVNNRCTKHNRSLQNGSFNTSDDSFSAQELSLNELGQGDNSMVGKSMTATNRKNLRNKSVRCDCSYGDIFGSKEQLTNLIRQEEHALEESGSNDVYVLVQARDDLKNKINDAIEKNQVTEYLLALAASVSPKLWRDASQVYIEQMIHADRIFDAVNFLLALGEDKEAVDLLCERKRFKEAFAMARLRFEDESIVKDIVEKWVHFCSSSGLYRLGAHCYMYLNDEENASRLLSKSKQSKDALLAAKLLKYYQPDRAMELAAECLKKDLTNLSSQTVEDIFIEFPEIRFMKPWYLSLKYFTEETPNTGSVTKWIIGWLKNETTTISEDFIRYSENTDFEKLENMIVDIKFQMNYNELTLYVSAQAALYFSGIFNSHFEVPALRHFIRGLSHCYNFRVVNSNQVYSDKAYPMMRLLKLMFPAGVRENFTKPSESGDTDQLYKSVNAYFCDFVVTWLAVCDDLPKSLKCFERQDVTRSSTRFKETLHNKNTENDINNVSKIEMDSDNSLNIIKDRKTKLQKVNELFNLFLDDVLNEDTIEYFKNIFQLKKYETNTTHNDSHKMETTSIICGRTPIENEHLDSRLNLNTSENSNVVTEFNSNLSSEQNDILDEISNKDISSSYKEYQKCNSLKENNQYSYKLNNEIYSNRCKNTEKSNVPKEQVLISDLLFDAHVSLEDVKILRGKIEKFEKERVSAPNPFIFVCTVRDFLAKHKDSEPELVTRLEVMLANLVDKHGII